MQPLIIRGNVWRVTRVSPGDPFLIDRTGVPRIATTDVRDKVIRISETVAPPLLDKVMLHEAAHAVMEETGVSDLLMHATDEVRIASEELLAWFLETYAIEIIDAVRISLGRDICVDGLCIGGQPWK